MKVLVIEKGNKMKTSYPREGSFVYDFDELEIDNSGNVYEGRCVISWEYENDDESSGYRGGFSFVAEDIEVKIPIDQPPWLVPKHNPMHKAIEKAIEESSYVLSLVEKDADPGL